MAKTETVQFINNLSASVAAATDAPTHTHSHSLGAPSHSHDHGLGEHGHTHEHLEHPGAHPAVC